MMKTAADTPLISVLVPVYNMERYLKKCVDSILKQIYPHFEIVLVDDGSTDASPRMCDEYAQIDKRVRVIHQPNGGISCARNAGLHQAKGEYIAVVDADDWVEPDYLLTLLSLCRRYGTDLSACNHLICRENGKTELRFSEDSPEKVLTCEDCCRNILYHGIPDVSVWGKLYHSSVLKAVCYPEGMVYEDTFTIAETIAASGKIAFTASPLYHYRIRNDSISRDSFHPSKLDYLAAVDKMCDDILSMYPEMKKGTIRRRTHAALSVRRYFVDCDRALFNQRQLMEEIVRKNAISVLSDIRAPLRDKLAICAILCGSRVYDAFWKFYARKR